MTISKQQNKGLKPVPRLKHIEPGQTFTLKVPPRTYVLLRKCEKYGYVEGGKIGLSAEIKDDGMVFGDGRGWRKV